MPKETEEASFENFPRQPLPEMVSRRELLPAIFRKMRVEAEKNQGQKVISLSHLGTAEDDDLAKIVPVIVEDASISTRDGFVVGAAPESDRKYQLFPLVSPALAVFNMFNGFNTMAQVSQKLEATTGWEPERCFAYTRGLFLALVVAGLCRPRDG